jgi:hypothetical protein
MEKKLTKYPKMMRGTETGVLVLFADKDKGISLNSVHNTIPFGYFSAFWHKMENFENVNADIIIKNQNKRRKEKC